MIPVLTECCYTCDCSLVVNKICKKKNMRIRNIYSDKCSEYSKRTMHKCEICNCYVIELKSHVKHFHQKTMSEYIILTQNKDTNKTSIKRGSLWDM